MTISEEWRPIPGFDGYEVSDLGRVMSYRRPTPIALKPKRGPKGYLYVGLRLDPSDYQARTKAVHRVVLLAFVGACPDGQEVRHLDGDKSNNALSNLAYGTKRENAADTRLHGTHPHGRKTHCPQGHPYDEVNTIAWGNGWRKCRTCVAARRAARNAQG